MDRKLALHAGSRGFEQFFRSNRPGYQHPVSSELENSGIRVAIGDCSVTELAINSYGHVGCSDNHTRFSWLPFLVAWPFGVQLVSFFRSGISVMLFHSLGSLGVTIQ